MTPFVFNKPIRLAQRTLDAINKELEEKQESSHRMHLGASEIGKPCDRQLWYKFRWAVKQTHEGRLLRVFSRGHKEEERFVAYLRSIGITVWEFSEEPDPKKPGQFKQWKIADHAGHFGGSLDGVLDHLPEFPDDPALTEFKTHSKKSFEKLVASGVQIAKPEHFTQMQVYMLKMDLPRALYMAVNKDNDELYCEIVERQDTVGERAIERAGQIIWANEPPARIDETGKGFECTYCPFNRLCHFGTVEPDRNCRTCIHSRPTSAGGGDWQCMNKTRRLELMFPATNPENENFSLTEKRQREGCHKYEARPDLTTRQP